jgi:flagellar protein FliO/FliZ
MRLATVLVTEAGQATGPDLTRYLVVCALSIAALLVLSWLFRRAVGGRLKARAAKRSLQVLDVLPLSGKQKLVVVRCYDRSFLLGTGEKEVRVLAELDAEPLPQAASEALPATLARAVALRPAVATRSFGSALEGELALRPAVLSKEAPAKETVPPSRSDASPGSKAWPGSKGGVLA